MGKIHDQAYVTLATNDSYALGALVLAYSLKNVGTQRELAVIITPMVSSLMRNHLNSIFDYVACVDVLESHDSANLALIKRPELGVTFTKINCWKLTNYRKCVFLDSDCLVIRNCDELFEREELSAAPDIGWPDCFNSGVFVFVPSNQTFKAVLDLALTEGSFDGGDQGLLNTFFSSWATKDIHKHLSFIYNMASSATYSYLSAYKKFMNDVKIVHFLGPVKPWNASFNFETGNVNAGGPDPYRTEHLQMWWNIYKQYVHEMLDPKFKTSIMGESQSHPPQVIRRLSDKEHKDAWEGGKIDYMGADAFENIQKHIESQVQHVDEKTFKPLGEFVGVGPGGKRPQVVKVKKGQYFHHPDERDDVKLKFGTGGDYVEVGGISGGTAIGTLTKENNTCPSSEEERSLLKDRDVSVSSVIDGITVVDNAIIPENKMNLIGSDTPTPSLIPTNLKESQSSSLEKETPGGDIVHVIPITTSAAYLTYKPIDTTSVTTALTSSPLQNFKHVDDSSIEQQSPKRSNEDLSNKNDVLLPGGLTFENLTSDVDNLNLFKLVPLFKRGQEHLLQMPSRLISAHEEAGTISSAASSAFHAIAKPIVKHISLFGFGQHNKPEGEENLYHVSKEPITPVDLSLEQFDIVSTTSIETPSRRKFANIEVTSYDMATDQPESITQYHIPLQTPESLSNKMDDISLLPYENIQPLPAFDRKSRHVNEDELETSTSHYKYLPLLEKETTLDEFLLREREKKRIQSEFEAIERGVMVEPSSTVPPPTTLRKESLVATSFSVSVKDQGGKELSRKTLSTTVPKAIPSTRPHTAPSLTMSQDVVHSQQTSVPASVDISKITLETVMPPNKQDIHVILEKGYERSGFVKYPSSSTTGISSHQARPVSSLKALKEDGGTTGALEKVRKTNSSSGGDGRVPVETRVTGDFSKYHTIERQIIPKGKSKETVLQEFRPSLKESSETPFGKDASHTTTSLLTDNNKPGPRVDGSKQQQHVKKGSKKSKDTKKPDISSSKTGTNETTIPTTTSSSSTGVIKNIQKFFRY